MRTDGQTERHDEAIGRLSQFCERAYKFSGILNIHARNKNAYTVFVEKMS